MVSLSVIIFFFHFSCDSSSLPQSNARKPSHTRRRFNCSSRKFGGVRGASTTTAATISSSIPTTTSTLLSTSILFEEESDVRLPRNVRPLHYLVKLQPHINGNLSILGYVEVEMEVLEDTFNITLHITDIITHNDTIRVGISWRFFLLCFTDNYIMSYSVYCLSM